MNFLRLFFPNGQIKISNHMDKSTELIFLTDDEESIFHFETVVYKIQ